MQELPQSAMKRERPLLKFMSLVDLGTVKYRAPDDFIQIEWDIVHDLSDAAKKAVIESACAIIRDTGFRQRYHGYWRSWLVAVVKALKAELEPHD